MRTPRPPVHPVRLGLVRTLRETRLVPTVWFQDWSLRDGLSVGDEGHERSAAKRC
jgi:hypothetical protein